jgi:hypothetical protein
MQFFPGICVSISSGLNFFECSLEKLKFYTSAIKEAK